MAKRATRAEWLERVRAWKASGKSRAGFAEGKEYSGRSLGWWAWKLASEGEAIDAKPTVGRRVRRQETKSLALVELVTPAPPSSAPLILRVGAVEVVVGRGFDRELLSGVLDVLEARR